jgi:hypothetical protein
MVRTQKLLQAQDSIDRSRESEKSDLKIVRKLPKRGEHVDPRPVPEAGAIAFSHRVVVCIGHPFQPSVHARTRLSHDFRGPDGHEGRHPLSSERRGWVARVRGDQHPHVDFGQAGESARRQRVDGGRTEVRDKGMTLGALKGPWGISKPSNDTGCYHALRP